MTSAPASAVNFRDLGGLPIAGGGQVRPGLLFRSASPQFLTPDDARRWVHDTGLRLVLDLRYAGESATEGLGPLADLGVRTANIPVVGVGGTKVEMNVLNGDMDHLSEHYIGYVRRNPATFVDAVRTLAAPDGLPALIHCAAGKDRTGVMVAVLLAVLGVPDDVIAEDYGRTAENLPDIMRHLRTAATYANSIGRRAPDDPFTMAQPSTMHAFLAWLCSEHGSARGMLLASGLEPEALDTLTDRLVAPVAA